MSNRRLSKRQKDRIQAIQERRRERANLKQSIRDEELQNLAQLSPEMLGTVITNYGSQVDIEGSEGPYHRQILRCHKRANLDTLVTGDRGRPCSPRSISASAAA